MFECQQVVTIRNSSNLWNNKHFMGSYILLYLRSDTKHSSFSYIFSNFCKLKNILKNMYIEHMIYCEGSRSAQAQSVTVQATSRGFDYHSRKWNIYLILYFHIIALISRQCFQNSAENGERSVLTLGSLYVSCFVQATAWSWFFNLLLFLFQHIPSFL